MNALGIIAFVVALLLSVMLHEAGHFLMARRFGMKVTEFFVGFGPRLWSCVVVKWSTASKLFQPAAMYA